MHTPPTLSPTAIFCPTCNAYTPGHGYDWQVYCPVCSARIGAITLQHMPFGKFKGRAVHQMDQPEEQRYLTWFLGNVDRFPEPLYFTILYCLGRLPMHEQPPIPAWAALLELRYPICSADVKGAYRALAKKYHPDAGGSDEQMKLLNAARAQATAYLSQ